MKNCCLFTDCLVRRRKRFSTGLLTMHHFSKICLRWGGVMIRNPLKAVSLLHQYSVQTGRAILPWPVLCCEGLTMTEYFVFQGVQCILHLVTLFPLSFLDVVTGSTGRGNFLTQRVIHLGWDICSTTKPHAALQWKCNMVMRDMCNFFFVLFSFSFL